MATRSRIGIVNEDGTVSSIYCHWDGYPSNNGRILVEHYTDREKVKELIELGSISSLNREVAPPILFENEGEQVKKGVRMLKKFGVVKNNHSFENPMEGVTVAYHRDRGEEYSNPRVNESIEDYFDDDNEEYGYLFTLDGEWLVKPCYGNNSVTQPVNEVLAEET
jgi:hypothetical protein